MLWPLSNGAKTNVEEEEICGSGDVKLEPRWHASSVLLLSCYLVVVHAGRPYDGWKLYGMQKFHVFWFELSVYHAQQLPKKIVASLRYSCQVGNETL